MRKPQRAFTLVELLVVIGIIAILIGILIPVVGAVKKAAYAADSRNQIKVVGNAIDRYQTDFNAYPGVFSNAAIAAGKTLSSGTAGPLSQSENCFLSLVGGIETNVAWVPGGAAVDTTAFKYVAANAGRGPLTFSPIQKRLGAYLEVTPASASITGSYLDLAGKFGNDGGVANAEQGVNNGVPEFIDRFPASLPIIYMRAKVGAAVPAGSPKVADNTGTLQYDTRELINYSYDPATKKNPSTVPNPGQVPRSNANVSTDFANWDAYFLNSNLQTQAKRHDTYILISPGEDRIYGTSDDICNFSF